MEVACGQCIGCRLDRSRMWAARMVHESGLPQNRGRNSFITLTYRNLIRATEQQKQAGQYIPSDWSLDKTHFQKFMKRLRKHFAPRTIKFYHCGEYGNKCKHGIDLEKTKCPLCNVGRPHYHAILFNCDFAEDLYAYDIQNGETRYSSPTLEKLWGFGRCDVGQFSMQSAGYVARYAMKKITGVLAEEHYESVDLDGTVVKLQPEYATMSNGIGREWYEKYKSDCFPSDEVPVPGHGVFPKVPRYYEEIYKAEDPDGHERMKARRLDFKRAHADDYTPERLIDKYKVKKAAIRRLQRNAQC